ncbi:hypothetical protein [Microbacterium sp. gxy059]|uniref:hypothetical protein n=1 Tax=Microbacterium sp. gxy059 TaxID=2957199 RepID=UPI003D96B5AC
MSTPAQNKNDRSDIGTVVTVGILVVAYILYVAVTRLSEMFSVPGSVTAPVPMPASDSTVSTGLDAAASADTVLLSVAGVNAISTGSFVVSIALPALAYASAALLGIRICRNLLRGDVFSPANARITTVASLLLAGGALVGAFFRVLGLNGMLAAAGGDFGEHTRVMLDVAPVFLAAIAIGVLPVIFRRGLALQKETEGLV